MELSVPGGYGMLDKQGRQKDPNMYRTSYNDMCKGLEVCVKSDFPSGYGGHVPTVRHQVLFRDSPEALAIAARAKDPTRDSFGDFAANINGIPYLTKNAKKKTEGPSAGYFPPTLVQPPWAIDIPRTGYGRPLDGPC
ncbi:hypothetical protein cyc_06056 [Cyclospora cayetanensis]|uniref:Uncharacterized protein n=1 Tax=Cyclospora cayetanensis TaxID=88456 RepID=A0A1D3CS80_9EIME|nr:hypothetical protein cyc_06056 [Cyclospora cayetanensis]